MLQNDSLVMAYNFRFAVAARLADCQAGEKSYYTFGDVLAKHQGLAVAVKDDVVMPVVVPNSAEACSMQHQSSS